MRYLILVIFAFFSLHAMSLEESIAYALQHNNGLKRSDINVKRSKEMRDAKHAQNFGRFDVIASYDHYNLSRTLAPLTPMSIVGSPDGAYKIPTTTDLFSTGIAYNVVLFNGFAQQSSYKISDLQYKSSEIMSKLGREELIYNVRNLYISLLALQDQLKAQYIYTESEQRLLKQIEKEKKLGTKSKLDLLRAQNAYEASKAQESIMEANIDILKASLSAVIGGKEFDKAEPLSIDMGEAEVKSVD
jgi:outer membrane protein TolC